MTHCLVEVDAKPECCVTGSFASVIVHVAQLRSRSRPVMSVRPYPMARCPICQQETELLKDIQEWRARELIR